MRSTQHFLCGDRIPRSLLNDSQAQIGRIHGPIIYFFPMRLIPLVLFAGTIAACSEPKPEAPPRSDSKVAEWAAIATAPKTGADSASLIELQLQVTVTDGWHVYSLTQDKGGPTPMSVKVEPPYVIAGEIIGPPPVKFQDPNFGIETETYSGEQIFRIPLKLAASSTLAPPPIEVKIRSQACSDNLCLPARTTTLTVTPEIGST
jgi:DsbC/DsbD-like thiol-disulfide interchange protein